MVERDTSILSGVAEVVRVALLGGRAAPLPEVGELRVRHHPSTHFSDLNGTYVTAPSSVIEFEERVQPAAGAAEELFVSAARVLNASAAAVREAWSGGVAGLAESGHLALPGVAEFTRDGSTTTCIINPSLQQAINARFTGYVDLTVLRGAKRVEAAPAADASRPSPPTDDETGHPASRGWMPDSAADDDLTSDDLTSDDLTSDDLTSEDLTADDLTSEDRPASREPGRGRAAWVPPTVELRSLHEPWKPAGDEDDAEQEEHPLNAGAGAERDRDEVEVRAVEPEYIEPEDILPEAVEPEYLLPEYAEPEYHDTEGVEPGPDDIESDLPSFFAPEFDEAAQAATPEPVDEPAVFDQDDVRLAADVQGDESKADAEAVTDADFADFAGSDDSDDSDDSDGSDDSDDSDDSGSTPGRKTRPESFPRQRRALLGRAIAILGVAGAIVTGWYFISFRQPADDTASNGGVEGTVQNPPTETEATPAAAVPEPDATVPAFERGRIDRSAGGFTIVVASEPTAAEAIAVAAAFPPEDVVDILEAEVDGQTRYRVAFGQYNTFALASRALNQQANRLPEGSWIGRIEQP